MTSMPIFADNKSKTRNLEKANLETEDLKYHIMTIRICIGEPRTCFNLAYDTGMMYVIVGNNAAKFKNLYDINYSKTSRSFSQRLYPLSYWSGSIYAREVSDYVLPENFPTPLYSFNFLLAFNTTSEYSFDGILGLGGHYPMKGQGKEFDERFSFIEYLKFNKLINEKIFGHKYTDKTTGTFYIGEGPEDEREYKLCTSLFYTEPLVYKWHCDLNSITLGDKVINLEAKFAAFSTGGTSIIAPKEEGLEIFNYIVSISGGKCSINSAEEGVQKLICEKSFSTSKVPNLHFLFSEGEIDLVFFHEDMFRLINVNGVQKLFFKITVIEKSEIWNLGEPVLKNYDMFFDYETETVGFKQSINFYGESWTVVIVLAIILFVIVGVGFYVIKNRKRIIMNFYKRNELEQINNPNTFDEGHQLGDIE